MRFVRRINFHPRLLAFRGIRQDLQIDLVTLIDPLDRNMGAFRKV